MVELGFDNINTPVNVPLCLQSGSFILKVGKIALTRAVSSLIIFN